MAEQLLACSSTTTFGPDSLFGYFQKHNARLIMAGCGFEYCTQFHYFEEERQVPYRHYKTFEGIADYGKGSEKLSAKMFVRSREIDAENNWSALISQLYDGKCVQEVPLWGGHLKAVNCSDLSVVARRLLLDDPMSMVHDAARVRVACTMAKERRTKAPIRIALLGSSNLEMLKSRVVETMAELIGDRQVETYVVPYGQMFRELADSSSTLHAFKADFTLFGDRLEDLAGAVSLDFAADEMVTDKVARYAAAIARYRVANAGWIFVATFPVLQLSLHGAADERVVELVGRLNADLAKAVDGLPEVKLLDMGTTAATHCDGPVFDPRLWFLGRFPYGEAFTRRLSRRLVGLVLAATGRTVRLLAIDLDNTLWGGVLGDDGIDGIAIGGDYPGNAHQSFQRGLKVLSERGIALALLSKNDDDLAVKALAELPAMVLRPSDFVARRINWSPKWRNVAELCSELSLGPASVLFIDDNPAEREQMRCNQPEVKVLDLPSDPSLFLQTLLESPWLECLTLTEEDRKRATAYKGRAALLEAKAESGANVEDFYASLGTSLFMQRYDAGNAARALQLLQKTNQFNTTTRRHGQAEIEQFLAAGDDVYVVGLQDRYSEFENIGVVVIRWHKPEHGWGLVDSFLLSCRVLGRGIESGILHWLLAQARSRSGMHGLIGEVVETPRNTPARTVFADAGFVPGPSAGLWRFDLRMAAEQIPPWLTVRSGHPLLQTGD